MKPDNYLTSAIERLGLNDDLCLFVEVGGGRMARIGDWRVMTC